MRFLLRLENVFSFVSAELGRLSIRGSVAIRNLFPAGDAETDWVERLEEPFGGAAGALDPFDRRTVALSG
jgi:hypothetical protein